MFLSAFRIRLGLIVSGLFATLVYLALGGSFGPGRNGMIQIEYGAYPEKFRGLEVEIDGRIAGTLEPFGSATRTGFVVQEGEHRVRVLDPSMASQPRDVRVARGQGVLLILDVVDAYVRTGGMKPMLGFQG